jgi:hypothetical protein
MEFPLRRVERVAIGTSQGLPSVVAEVCAMNSHGLLQTSVLRGDPRSQAASGLCGGDGVLAERHPSVDVRDRLREASTE